MVYGICRISKLKAGSIAASEWHTLRKRQTPNANPEVDNLRLIGDPTVPGGPDLETLVRQRIGDQTIRKNAVLCVEILLTASPEYFRPQDPGRAGYYQSERLERFQQVVHQWLVTQYGNRIVRAECHLDEATPHIHAYLVPLDEKGKLNCRALFGGREKLSRFQDSFAEAVACLGLERGIKGSRAFHTKVKDYYAAVTQAPDLSLDALSIHHQLADRRLALKKATEMEQTAKALAQEKEGLQRRIQALGVEVDAQQRQAKYWQSKYQELVNQLRDLPLQDVAEELGLEPSPKDRHKWKSEVHRISLNGSKFYDFQQLQGGGGAIDLVMHVNQCDFKGAISWLKERFGESATLQATLYYTRELVQAVPVAAFTPPLPDPSRWQPVRDYLTRSRRLPAARVDALHEQGLIYADAKQNAVFIRRSLETHPTITGAALRGTWGEANPFKGMAPGSKRSQGWFYFEQGGQTQDPIERVVLCESPIDTVSFAVMDRTASRKTLYLSTDGAGHIPLEFLQSQSVGSVVVAYDNDLAGEQMAQRVLEQLPQATRRQPQAKDWNQDLQNAFRLEKFQPPVNSKPENLPSQRDAPQRSRGPELEL